MEIRFAKKQRPAVFQLRHTEYQRSQLRATLVTVHWPPKTPFDEEPFTLMNERLS